MRNSILTAAILHVSLIMTAICAAPNPSEERTWTGVNGKTFVGIFHSTFDEGGKKVRFAGSSGKVITVALDNLSETDRELVLLFERKAFEDPSVPAFPAADLSEHFKELPTADRRKIPALASDEVGSIGYESIVHALCVSLLWWDLEGIMPVPKNGDFDRKADWLYKELTRSVEERGNETASLQQTKDGLAEYLEKRLEETGSCKSVIFTTIDADILSRLAAGNSIVVLKMTMKYAGVDESYATAAALESMTPDGTFVMHMHGRRLTGKMNPAPGKKGAWDGAKVHDFDITNPEAIHPFYQGKGARFSIGDGSWTGALVAEPFVYKTPGKKAPIPR
jgi:hypothetical protein